MIYHKPPKKICKFYLLAQHSWNVTWHGTPYYLELGCLMLFWCTDGLWWHWPGLGSFSADIDLKTLLNSTQLSSSSFFALKSIDFIAHVFKTSLWENPKSFFWRLSGFTINSVDEKLIMVTTTWWAGVCWVRKHTKMKNKELALLQWSKVQTDKSQSTWIYEHTGQFVSKNSIQMFHTVKCQLYRLMHIRVGR